MPELGFPNKSTPHGNAAYYVCRLAESSKRDALANLFLLKQELTDLYAMQDPGVARLKLQWWQQQFQNTNSVHPLVVALQQTLSHQAKSHIIEMLNTIDRQLHRQAPNDLDALLQMMANSGGHFAQLINHIEQVENNPQAIIAGQWIFLIEHLQLMGRRLREDIRLLPPNLQSQHQLAKHSLISDESALQKLLMDLVEQIIAELPLPKLKKKSSLNRYLQLQLQLLSLLKKEQFAVYQQKISLTPLGKLWIAWRFS